MSYIHLGSYAEGIGGKANGFYRLKEAGIRFPAGIVLRKPDIEDILSGNVDEFQTSVLQMGSCLAIRSSANVEDGEKQSYAGMFQTCLNVKNDIQSILTAIKQVYDSKNGSFLEGYHKQSHTEIDVSIIVQEMVYDIKYNGVIFGDTVDEKGEHPVLLDFCKEGKNKIVDGHDRGNQMLFYDNGFSFACGRMVYKGEEKEIIWVDRVCEILNQVKSKFGHIKFDIEWCVDQNNSVYILQLRPTTSTIMVQSGDEAGNLIIGSYGIASGGAVVFDVDSPEFDEKAKRFKRGDIFVGKYMDTRCYDSLEKAGGIIVCSSSILAHAALVARENHVPCMIVQENIIDRIQENDEIKIDTYSKSITVNGERIQFCDRKVDWAGIYDFDSFTELEYLNHKVLLEQTLSGVVAHVPEEVSNEFCNKLKREYREVIASDIEVRKSSKYLWYYEYCRYKRIKLFHQIAGLCMKAIDHKDLDAVAKIYENVYRVVQELNKQKCNENVTEKQIYLDEVIRSIFFIMDMFIPLGKGYKHIYLKIMPVLMNRGISFSEFVNCKRDKIDDAELLEERNLIDLLGGLRDHVTEKFCSINAFDYDYYDKRTELICNDLGACNEELFLQELMEKMNILDEQLWQKYAALVYSELSAYK